MSTAATTLPSCLAVASKNISSVSLPGSGPLNSGGAAVFDPVDGFALPFHRLGDGQFLGVELEVDLADLAVQLPPAGGRRRFVHVQLARVRPSAGCVSPVGDGGVRVPPLPPCIGEVITHRRAGCRGARPRASRWPPSGESRFRLGPVQRTGMTPCSDHSATTVLSSVIAEITMVVGVTPFIMPANQLVNLHAVRADRPAQLDVAELHPGRQLPHHGVVAALFALLDHDLAAEALAAVEQPERELVDLDLETDADGGILLVHRIFLIAGGELVME